MKNDQNEKSNVENVIKGPWKAKGKREIVVPDNDVIEMRENIIFADDLTEQLIVQMIHTMGENGIDIGEKDFVRDIGFVIESVKGAIYRDLGLSHPILGIMEQMCKVEASEDGKKVNTEVDLDLVEMVSAKFLKSDDEEEPNSE